MGSLFLKMPKINASMF